MRLKCCNISSIRDTNSEIQPWHCVYENSVPSKSVSTTEQKTTDLESRSSTGQIKKSLHEYNFQTNEATNKSLTKFVSENKYLTASTILIIHINLSIDMNNYEHKNMPSFYDK